MTDQVVGKIEQLTGAPTDTVMHTMDMAMVTREEFDKWTKDSAILKHMLSSLYSEVVLAYLDAKDELGYK